MELFVAINGSDENPGTKDKPFKTLTQARNAIRKNHEIKRETCFIFMREGTHYLEESLAFNSEDSGTKECPVEYSAYENEKVIISGGQKLSLDWEKCVGLSNKEGRQRKGICVAKTPSGMSIDQLFINGECQRMARYPNFNAELKTSAYQGFSADAFSEERVANWESPEGGYIHAMHKHCWGGYHYRITGKNNNQEIEYEGGWQNNRQMGMHNDFRMVENIFEELDAPGEWFHDKHKSLLYYIPEADCDINSATVEVVCLKHLIEFSGSSTDAVRHISFNKIKFCHAARTFMETKEPLLRSDWAIYRGGAVVLTGTKNIKILNCEFDQLGGNAIFINGYNRNTVVKGCYIHDCGASGVCFVGDPSAVRNPLFEYKETNDLFDIDLEKGPQNERYPADCIVEDCLICGIGRVERQPAGVQISMSQRITIKDTSVYDCARSGINIGDGCWGGHLIKGCDVFDTVLETDDHGSFNSWGRDRYWHSDQKETEKAVAANPELPFLDAMETTEICFSRWRCDHGWDIDLDDGSTNYKIHHNLMLGRGLKLREGYRREAWNNITINSTLHPHVWYENSGDVVTSNIFMKPPRGARTPVASARGKKVDENFYASFDDSVKNKYREFGWDLNSEIGDPQFKNPKSGDYRISESSPALKFKFENFAMETFGVKNATLRSIAKTPVIPEFVMDKNDPTKRETSVQNKWMGAVLHPLEGEEYSAYGVSKNDGGVALLNFDKESKAKEHGFQEGDCVQKINGEFVSDVLAFYKAMNALSNDLNKIVYVRNQKVCEIELFY